MLSPRTLRRRAARGTHGMTLIEIMVVLTLLGLIMTVLAANFFGMAENQKVSICHTQMQQLKGRLDAFKLHYGRYPSQGEGLNALVRPPADKRGMTPAPFLDDATITYDPWGTPLQYNTPARSGGKAFEIVSLGSDGVPGGENTSADFSNWQLAGDPQ